MEIFYDTISTKNTLLGLTDILYLQLGMSVKRPSRNILKTKGGCATPHFSSPKLKTYGFSNALSIKYPPKWT